MKTNSLVIAIAFLFGSMVNLGYAQDMKKRKSPLKTVEGVVSGADVVINYSAPSVKERTIWGDLVPYGKIWRTGANEATKIEVSKDVKVNGKSLPAGVYSIFTIPSKDSWTVVFNKDADQWGAYKYDESKDALRVEAKLKMVEKHQEMLSFSISKNSIDFHWEKLTFSLAVE